MFARPRRIFGHRPLHLVFVAISVNHIEWILISIRISMCKQMVFSRWTHVSGKIPKNDVTNGIEPMLESRYIICRLRTLDEEWTIERHECDQNLRSSAFCMHIAPLPILGIVLAVWCIDCEPRRRAKDLPQCMELCRCDHRLFSDESVRFVYIANYVEMTATIRVSNLVYACIRICDTCDLTSFTAYSRVCIQCETESSAFVEVKYVSAILFLAFPWRKMHNSFVIVNMQAHRLIRAKTAYSSMMSVYVSSSIVAQRLNIYINNKKIVAVTMRVLLAVRTTRALLTRVAIIWSKWFLCRSPIELPHRKKLHSVRSTAAGLPTKQVAAINWIARAQQSRCYGSRCSCWILEARIWLKGL